MKIGIMGGTFNPIHNGHIALAQKAYDELSLDKVLFMPSGTSYLKQNVLPAKHRVEMVKRAIADYPQFELSLIEVNRAGNTYTYETLQQLKQENPQTTYYFIIGADSLLYMDHWKEPEIIFSLATIACTVRDEADMNVITKKGKELEEKGADIVYLDMPAIPISSTQIRELAKAHKSIDNLVSTEVVAYMQEEHLYEED